MSSNSDIEHLKHQHFFLGDRHDENARRTLFVVTLTAVMMVAEIAAGYIFNSMALLADGFHMASHAGAMAITFFAYAYAKRHAYDQHFSFGTGKVGDLTGFASALILGLIAVGIAAESAERLINPRPVAFAEASVVAVLGLLVNVVSALLLREQHDHDHGHGADHHDHHHRDHNLRSAYVHVIADALTSILAIVALLGGQFLGWVWLDPLMGLAGALVISIWSWNLMRDTAAVLLDVADRHIAEEIRDEVEDGSAWITDLHVWRLGPGAYAAIVSVVGSATPEAIRQRLAKVHEVVHLTVEVR